MKHRALALVALNTRPQLAPNKFALMHPHPALAIHFLTYGHSATDGLEYPGAVVRVKQFVQPIGPQAAALLGGAKQPTAAFIQIQALNVHFRRDLKQTHAAAHQVDKLIHFHRLGSQLLLAPPALGHIRKGHAAQGGVLVILTHTMDKERRALFVQQVHGHICKSGALFADVLHHPLPVRRF